MATFEVGNVVQLKSGGPLMTIHNVGDYSPMGPNPGALCVWFEKSKREEAVFDPRTLEHYLDEMPDFETPGPLV